MGGQIVKGPIVKGPIETAHRVAVRRVELRHATLRALDRFLKSEEYEEYYEAANDDEKQSATQLISKEDLSTLREYVADKRLLSFETMPIRRLRELARLQFITGYSRISRRELIRQLRKQMSTITTSSAPNKDIGEDI
jgi:hypothetical protein